VRQRSRVIGSDKTDVSIHVTDAPPWARALYITPESALFPRVAPQVGLKAIGGIAAGVIAVPSPRFYDRDNVLIEPDVRWLGLGWLPDLEASASVHGSSSDLPARRY